MSRIAVAGGAGYLGTALVDALARRWPKLSITVIDPEPLHLNDDVAELGTVQHIEDKIEHYQAADLLALFYLACPAHPGIDDGPESLLALPTFINSHDVPICFSSTIASYNATMDSPLKAPYYSSFKRAQELMVDKVFRSGTLTGPNNAGTVYGFVDKMIIDGFRDRRFSVWYPDGIRSITDIRTTVDRMVSWLNRGAPRESPENLFSPWLSFRVYARIIEDCFRKEGVPVTVEFGTGDGGTSAFNVIPTNCHPSEFNNDYVTLTIRRSFYEHSQMAARISE